MADSFPHSSPDPIPHNLYEKSDYLDAVRWSSLFVVASYLSSIGDVCCLWISTTTI
jgi:hypothetical protein